MEASDPDVVARCAEVRRTPLRRRPGVLVMIEVLRGSLDVRVSCERFTLSEGDYAVLNAGDPYQFTGTEENVTAILEVKLTEFEREIPGLQGVIFACESFDLARYRGVEDSLRQQLLAALTESGEAQRRLVVSLLRSLADGYAFEDYYQRDRDLTPGRRELFRRIVIAMREQLSQRDVLGKTAEVLHYSKGSISRVVREVSAVSFSDLLTYLRVAQAEIELLESESTMVSIAESCGFSDVKYLTRAFRAWFGESPADYRRGQRPQMRVADRATDVPVLGAELLARHRRAEFRREQVPRLSMTPLLVKNLGGRSDLFRAIAELGRERTVVHHPEPLSQPHLLPFRVTTGGAAPIPWADLVDGVDHARYTPVLVVTVSDSDGIDELIREMRALTGQRPACWVMYEAGREQEAEALAVRLRRCEGIATTPIRLG